MLRARTSCPQVFESANKCMSAATDHLLEIWYPRYANMPTLVLIWRLDDPSQCYSCNGYCIFSLRSAWHPASASSSIFVSFNSASLDSCRISNVRLHPPQRADLPNKLSGALRVFPQSHLIFIIYLRFLNTHTIFVICWTRSHPQMARSSLSSSRKSHGTRQVACQRLSQISHTRGCHVDP